MGAGTGSLNQDAGWVRLDAVPPRPWRNGAGTTRELHHDDGWRVSVAEIDGPAPFSSFPGLDRTFVVLSGAVGLTVDGVRRRLGPGELLAFPGEAVVRARPVHGPARVVNVMAERTRRRVDVEVTDLSDPAPVVAALVLLSGRLVLPGGSPAPGDAVVGASTGSVRPQDGRPARAVLVRPRHAPTEGREGTP